MLTVFLDFCFEIRGFPTRKSFLEEYLKYGKDM